ncbi:MAG TPA: c-type cytochrome [Sphingomicrobium sp.]|nr:c-type cytochrome [Sphingomicrobium sp.]
MNWGARVIASVVIAALEVTILEPALAASGGSIPAMPAGDPSRGQLLYEQMCSGCHSLDSNRVGPAHRGVVGRRIASVPGYTYSYAIRRLGGSWTRRRLEAWLAGPQRVAPGSRMFFTVDDPAERRDIITYLATSSIVARTNH